MKDDQGKKGQKNTVMIVTTALVVIVLAAGAVGVKMLVSREVRVKKVERTVTMVRLPPPPRQYEKPPEMEKREEPEEQEQVTIQEQQQEAPGAEPPPGEQLGVDAEGGAGGDGFGLVGNKGGRSLVGSGGGGMDLLRRFQGYTNNLQAEIGRELMKRGKLTSGGREAYVKIVLDDSGTILSHLVYRSSGDRSVDKAIGEVLDAMKRVSQPPPDGMPRVLRIRITVPS